MPIATKTWTVGATLPAADLNTYVRDVVEEIDPASQGQGDLLVVNAAKDGYDFFDVSANAGKVIAVNAGGTGLEGRSFDIFGDGSDGALHVTSGTTTLAGNKKYTTVTIDAGCVLATAGYTVRCTGTFTNNGTVRNNGSNGTNGTGGGGGGGGAAGSGGGSGGGGSATNGIGGTNGTSVGARGGNGGNGNGSTTGQGGYGTGTARIGGAGGAGGGASSGTGGGGGGGGGGGTMRIIAPLITGTGVFEAKGGNGGNAYTSGFIGGGGGGGQGGNIEFVTLAAVGGSITTSVAGGTAGTGNGGGGGDGTAGGDGLVLTINLASATS